MNIVPLIKKDIKLYSKSKGAVILTFLVPMLITLIFGAIFGGFGGQSAMSNIKVLLVDEDKSVTSQKLINLLDSLEAISIATKFKSEEDFVPFDVQTMDDWIKKGNRKLGIVIPAGFENSMKKGKKVVVEIHYDPKFAVEYSMVNGLLQKTIMENFPQIIFGGLMNKADEYLGEKKGSEFQKNIDGVIRKYFPIPENRESVFDMNNADFKMTNNPLEVTSVKLLGEEKENEWFAQYVAGMAVMFLLFSVTRAGASLLEEKHNGTINRLLVAPISKKEILTAKMIYISLHGFVQLLVLFLFGWLVFGLNIFKNVPALLTMIIVTALAASALGIFIASVCRNLHQVSSLSTLLILGMSALGGSMVPTFLMPTYIQFIGKFTFNYWAMKGFTDIFWRDFGLGEILPSIIILAAVAIVFSSVAIKLFRKRLV